jgi:hypothetical protein
MDKSLAKLKNALDQQLHYVSTGAGNAEVSSLSVLSNVSLLALFLFPWCLQN